MGLKDDLKREMRNVMKDVEKEAHKTWKVDYKGHSIEVIHQLKEENLLIDGITVVTKKRKYLFSHIMPYSKLSGTLDLGNGIKHTVFVKLGGYSYKSFNCIIKVDKDIILNDSLELDFLPWNHKEKIVPFIKDQVKAHNRVVDDGLPDDEYIYEEDQPRMAAGLSDQLADDIPTPLYVKKLLKLFKKQLHHPSNKTRKATYEEINFDSIASYGGEFIQRFDEAGFDESLVQREALWLLEHAAHREVVKFAVTVLGCTNCGSYKELLCTIGMHEEFTSYVIFALRDGTKESNNQIWKLAQSVHGWGKITAVEQLEPSTPEIKEWLLTKGCENVIMNGYLAYICADKGELAVALYQDTISQELYRGIGLIIDALLYGDVDIDPDIEKYLFEHAILFRFVNHARTHCQTLEDLFPLIRISEFLNAEEIWNERSEDSWKLQERASTQQMMESIINDSRWPQLTMDALKRDVDVQVLEIARFFQLDVTPSLFSLLQKYPLNSELYFAIMESDHRQHVADLCLFAENHLSLSNLTDEEQDCLIYIIQDLHGHEGVGLPLLQAALESSSDVIQYQALSVLEEWNPSIWQQPEIVSAIKRISTTANDKEDRKLADHLLTRTS